jgi:hypothetical protein
MVLKFYEKGEALTSPLHYMKNRSDFKSTSGT